MKSPLLSGAPRRGWSVACFGSILCSTALSHAVVSRDINTYALFAYDELVFKGGSTGTGSGNIVGGNIGVNYSGWNSDRDLAFGTSGRAIMSDGTQAVANVVRGDYAGANPTRLWDLFANETKPTPFPVPIDSGNGVQALTAPAGAPANGSDGWIIATADLPALPFTPGRASTNSAADLTLSSAANPHTLAPNTIHRDVRLNDNVVLNLGDGVYDMRDLSVGRDVTINVTDGAILQIDSTFQPNDDLMFGMNPQHNGGARVYVGGWNYGQNQFYNFQTTQVTNFAHNGADRSEQIHMQYFAPNSWLDLGGDNELYGRFWARRITGDPGNNVYFIVPDPSGASAVALGLFLAARRRRAVNAA